MKEEAKKAQEGARALFSGADTSHMPTTELAEEDFDEEGKDRPYYTSCKAELVPSRSEGRRAIQQGGVSIDGEKLTDIYHTVEKDAFLAGDGIVLKRGKKKFKKICVK